MKKHLKYILILLIILSSHASAQFYFFGRNKVQYQKFDWKLLRTEHFNIYYYGEMEEMAEVGAYYAEDAYNELKVKFNHIITNRIPLIFYNTSLHFQQTNTTPGFIPEGVGGFFEFIKGRVVIPSTGSFKDFRHVIRHELVHVFMTTKVFHILYDHKMPADRLPPIWFVEGIAEFLSTKPDDQAEMVMRDAVINNYFVSLENMYQIYGTFFMYKEGQNLLEFISKKYGEEKVLLFIDNFWMYSDFDKVIEYTLGITIKELDKEWLFYLRKKYYPLLAQHAPPDNAAKKLTDFGFNFSPVYYQINKKHFIYFVANRDGYSSLYRLEYSEKGNMEDVEPEMILRGEKSEEFESFHLFQSTIDISKNGIIAFSTKSGATDALHFYSIKEEGLIKDYQNDELVNISSPKFSDDGKYVVFDAVDQKGFSDIYMLNFENDSLARLTNDLYDDKQPTFGKTDNQIIFSSDRTGGKYEKFYNLFSYDLNSHEIKYVTYLKSNNLAPVLSPDKSKILFTSDYDGVRNIWELNLNRDGLKQKIKRITNFTSSAFDPTFADSSTIIFTGFEKFTFNIYAKEVNSAAVDTSEQITMDLDSAAGKWIPGMLVSNSERQKLNYEKEYTLDYAQSQVTTDPVYGTRGGALLSLSDLFGDDNYYFLIYNTADVQSDFLKSFNIAIQRINLSKRPNYGYGIFHFSGRRYDIRESDEFFYERSFGGFFVLNFPLSKFQRIETDVSIANSDKQILTGVIERKALLVSNTISYVADNSLWGPSGPVDGIRARLLLGYTGDVKYSNVNYFTVIADYRQYFRIGFSSALAVRTALFYNEGKEARRYFMGGSWDLRGWPRWSIRGEKLWFSSVELRFPLLDQINLKFPFFNFSLNGIRGAAFFDSGGAWDTKYRQTLGSIGAGFRINLFGVLVLRYDIGKKIEDNFTHLQPGLFYQFFFGWDF